MGLVLSHNHGDHVSGLMSLRRELMKNQSASNDPGARGSWNFRPVARPHGEKNWSPGLSLHTVHGLIEDNVPEDSALVFNTAARLLILSGCAHAGIVNIAEYAVSIFPATSVLAIVGGLHLFSASEQTVAWTGESLKRYHVQYLLAGHCTGIESTYRLRELLGLNRKTAVVSVVGSSFTLGSGIDPRLLAQ
jgi:7,8-dihydropterin-6-yl-methyl-4-(beta-D-ribofuranosyl)aminobenzene 5'-phosphate synthase